MSNVAKLKTSDQTPPESPTDPLAKLREPFPANQISKLPKETKTQIDQRKQDCQKWGINCKVCGGWHHKNAVHLDYVGHAALTDRLLDTDRAWFWEPLSFTPDGLPAFDRNGGLWIKLTICGVTRMGYGSADGKAGGDAIKEIIGDALRNAAMRFGAALDLWHKGDLHGPAESNDSVGDGEPEDSGDRRPAAQVAAEAAILLCQDVAACDAWRRDNAAALNEIDDTDTFNAIVRFWKQHRASLLPMHPKANPPQQRPVRQDFNADELEGAFR